MVAQKKPKTQISEKHFLKFIPSKVSIIEGMPSNALDHKHGETVKYSGKDYKIIGEYLYFDIKFFRYMEKTDSGRYEAKIYYLLEGSEIDTLKEYIGIVKLKRNHTFNDLWNVFGTEDNNQLPIIIPKAILEDIYNKVPPMSAKDAIRNYTNTETRMLYFKYANEDVLVRDLKADIVSTETVTKTQVVDLPPERLVNKTFEELVNEEVDEREFRSVVKTREETYTLYKIDKSVFYEDLTGREYDRAENMMTEDIYIVQCVCPSTNDKFHLFVKDVDVMYNGKPDAIQAIASTISIDENAERGLTRDEYFKYIVKEA